MTHPELQDSYLTVLTPPTFLSKYDTRPLAILSRVMLLPLKPTEKRVFSSIML